MKELYELNVSVVTKINVPLVDKEHLEYKEICSIQKTLLGIPVNAESIYERQKKSYFMNSWMQDLIQHQTILIQN